MIIISRQHTHLSISLFWVKLPVRQWLSSNWSFSSYSCVGMTIFIVKTNTMQNSINLTTMQDISIFQDISSNWSFSSYSCTGITIFIVEENTIQNSISFFFSFHCSVNFNISEYFQQLVLFLLQLG